MVWVGSVVVVGDGGGVELIVLEVDGDADVRVGSLAGEFDEFESGVGEVFEVGVFFDSEDEGSDGVSKVFAFVVG